MKRRDFLKVAAGVSVLAVCPSTISVGASQIPMKEKKLAPGSQAKVYL
jgi:anaerobic selenocysteine-containing dehydrogenase